MLEELSMLTCKEKRKKGAGRKPKRIELTLIETGAKLVFTSPADLRARLHQGWNYSNQSISRNCLLGASRDGFLWKYLD